MMPIDAIALFAAGLALGALMAPALRLIRTAAVPAGASRATATIETSMLPPPRENAASSDGAPATAPPRLEWLSPERLARALLDWLQSPGGLIGEIAAREVEVIYNEMCCEMGWAARPWASVGSELRELLGGEKTYVWRGRQRVRVYKIPPPTKPARASRLRLAA